MEYFSHSWLPFIYQYGLGGVIFVVGLVLTLKAGSFTPSTNPRHKKWLAVLVLGYIWYFVMHGALTLAALGHERWAALGATVIMGVAGVATLIWFRRARGEA
jgi:hypothetical protein